jgi:plastocyanin
MLKFDSAFLFTDEQFTLTCTERGRYGYYCHVHGAPDSDIMTRTTVVE